MKIKAMKNVGLVRRRKIAIQKLEVLTDTIGQEYEEWVNWKELWVERNNLWGQEYYAAKSVNEENTLVFTARYVSFVDDIDSVNYRVLYNEKLYDIKHIDYLKDDGLWVKIKALERGINE